MPPPGLAEREPAPALARNRDAFGTPSVRPRRRHAGATGYHRGAGGCPDLGGADRIAVAALVAPRAVWSDDDFAGFTARADRLARRVAAPAAADPDRLLAADRRAILAANGATAAAAELRDLSRSSGK